MIYAGVDDNAYAEAISNGFEDMFGLALRSIVFGGDWEKQERSRAPYTDAWVQYEGGITLFASPNLTHACVEISGQGCERLISSNHLQEVLGCCKERITRVDIATDIETSTQPTEFVTIVSHERMRANGTQNSETGQTCYVGSKKSDRYARVYRYYKPHPRSHLLRIEHVFRRKYAKAVVSQILDTSLEAVAEAAGKAFGWAHSDWDIQSLQQADISIVAPERGQRSTVTWLVRSVAPAIRRLIADGTIRDPQQFFATYFIPD
jgi:DNA relaxase NicK